jgi:Putative peptidoglycan binding domain
MGKFLNSISTFIDSRTAGAAQPGGAPSTPDVGVDKGASSMDPPPGRTEADSTQRPQRSSAANRPAASDHREPLDDHGSAPAERQLPLVARPIGLQELAPPKLRPSRTLNLMRTSTGVAVTSRAAPVAQRGVAHRHESHLARLSLTEAERFRLQVMQVQLRLASLSLYEGPIDGNLGPETVTGVRYFQTLKGMRATGILAAGTLSALGVPLIG